ncbi:MULTISPECIES: GAF and ANTAR domain-containing protein [unclassified Knoellia]|uniref:GAF and ANTAR domain-containing protein n=1 Tax=Knoellia altitudinis TaxID=3404795 RepID=UPI00360C9188
MADTRERDIIHAFVELSNELVDGYDIVDLLSGWTTNCAQLLDVAAAGLLLADGRDVLHVVAASSERTHDLEVFQLQRHQGPCLDCFNTGVAVNVPNLEVEAHRWPDFVRIARSKGFASVHAVPMRLQGTTLGAFGLFGDTPGSLNEDDLALAQALIHVASVAIINERAASDRDVINAQLQHALTGRIVLEQAKGVLANEGNLEMQDAFAVLRRYARDHQRKLTVLADQVVNREVSGQEILRHARFTSIRP